MKTSEVLDRAADLIEERGWGSGPTSVMGVGGACLIGAMYAASNDGAFADDECAPYVWIAKSDPGLSAFHYLRHLDGYIYRPADLWHWNDTPGRTASEVVEVLRACAVIEASRERESVEVSA
jgi:hypothetical protein